MIPQRVPPAIEWACLIYCTFEAVAQHADAYAARVELRMDQGTQWTAIELQDCHKGKSKNQKRAGHRLKDEEIKSSAVKGGLQKGERILAVAVLWKMKESPTGFTEDDNL